MVDLRILLLFELVVFAFVGVIVLVVTENLAQLLFVDSVELVIGCYKSA